MIKVEPIDNYFHTRQGTVADLSAMFDEVSADKGMTSYPGTYDQFYAQVMSRRVHHEYKVYFGIWLDTDLTGLCAVHYGNQFIYSTQLARVVRVTKTVELCSLFISPRFRKMARSAVTESIKARLSYIEENKNVLAADMIIVSMKTQYDENGVPVGRKHQKWETPITENYTDDSIVKLTNTDPIIHPDVENLTQLYRGIGFEDVGLNPYESSLFLGCSTSCIQLLLNNLEKKEVTT